MLDTVLVIAAAYLATGAFLVRQCALETRLPGWRGQASVACAFLLMSAAWPLLAFYGLRARLRNLL
jgi:hypothetical protein